MTRRRALLVATVSAVVVVAAVGGSLWWSPRHSSTKADAAVPVATATVVRTDLSTSIQLSGTLGFAGSYTVSVQGAPGTVTALPQPGQLISRGEPVYEFDGTPVFLLYGARPSWRPLANGVTPGADVLELKQNLTALGYANATNLTVDTSFTWATNLAIRRWQQATGQPVTGQLALGRVVYEPGPIQILSTPASVGDLTSPGQPVLQASSTTPTITVPVPAAQTYLVHASDMVTVTLPSGTVTPGKVDSISAIASQTQSSTSGGGSSNSPSGPGQASVPAVVSLTDPAVAANLDQAPVTVNITDRTVTGVLAVPITALVALAGGGYGVWVDTGTSSTGSRAGRSLVAVTPGLFATTLVQVTAAGLQVGDKVEVPSQ
jgi:hypothetical protein